MKVWSERAQIRGIESSRMKVTTLGGLSPAERRPMFDDVAPPVNGASAGGGRRVSRRVDETALGYPGLKAQHWSIICREFSRSSLV